MKYPFILRPLAGGGVEVRFPDLVGARGTFPSERIGSNNAIAVLVDWIQTRQSLHRRVPLPGMLLPGQMHVVLTADMADAIHRHNRILETSGELQDLA